MGTCTGTLATAGEEISEGTETETETGAEEVGARAICGGGVDIGIEAVLELLIEAVVGTGTVTETGTDAEAEVEADVVE